MNILFGTSHARNFLEVNKLLVYDYPGASLKDLPKRKSTLNLKNKIVQTIKEKEINNIYFNFGQVDIDLGYYYKKYEKKEVNNYKLFVDDLILSYRNFLLEIKDLFPKNNVVIVGIFPPTLIDDDSFIKYTSRLINSDNIPKGKYKIEKRCEMSKYFNSKLNELALDIGLEFINFFDLFIDSAIKVIKKGFIKKGDHHLNTKCRNIIKKNFYKLK